MTRTHTKHALASRAPQLEKTNRVLLTQLPCINTYKYICIQSHYSCQAVSLSVPPAPLKKVPLSTSGPVGRDSLFMSLFLPYLSSFTMVKEPIKALAQKLRCIVRPSKERLRFIGRDKPLKPLWIKVFPSE